MSSLKLEKQIGVNVIFCNDKHMLTYVVTTMLADDDWKIDNRSMQNTRHELKTIACLEEEV